LRSSTEKPETHSFQRLADPMEQTRFLKDIVIAVLQAEDIEQAFQQTLELICEAAGWQYGRGSLVAQGESQQETHLVEWPAAWVETDSLAGINVYRLPVPVNGITGAVLEFSPAQVEPPDYVLDWLAEAAQQLGKRIERIQSIEYLQKREEHLTRLVESVKDYAFYTLDLDGRITSWNIGAQKIKGYQKQEIIGKHFSVFYTPQAIATNKPQLALEAARSAGRFDTQDWRVRKDGSLFWADVVIFPMVDSSGVLQGYSKLTRDLTHRKKMEAELAESQARHQRETAELRRRLIDGREAERLHMAQELHDGPIQDLYGLIFGLDAVESKIRSQSALAQIAEMKRNLQQVVSTLRGMIGDLRPPTLAPFGLEKAIRSHLQIFRETHPEIQVELDLDADRRTLPEDLRLAFYRVYQTSLANIVRHADANLVNIKLKLEDEQVYMEISDNGKGFIVPERWIKLVREGHLGLVGARERAEALGGSFIVESQPGEGTLVKVTIPRSVMDAEAENQSGR